MLHIPPDVSSGTLTTKWPRLLWEPSETLSLETTSKHRWERNGRTTSMCKYECMLLVVVNERPLLTVIAVCRWCWTARPFPACYTSSAALKSPFAKKHAGPSQTSPQETEPKYRWCTRWKLLTRTGCIFRTDVKSFKERQRNGIGNALFTCIQR